MPLISVRDLTHRYPRGVTALDGLSLELVHRTGTEFGIAVLVCSHLLGEIERVCDHLVAIDGGTALYVLAKPVARWRIVLTRAGVAAGATALLMAPTAILSALAVVGAVLYAIRRLRAFEVGEAG